MENLNNLSLEELQQRYIDLRSELNVLNQKRKEFMYKKYVIHKEILKRGTNNDKENKNK